MPEMERNLHQITQILREEDTVELVVRLETVYGSKTRYLAVICCPDGEIHEYCAVGVDFNDELTLGLVLGILSNTSIRLDGDGGFSITDGIMQRSHIFKPVSVQTMWSALQTLFKASESANTNKCHQIRAVKYYNSLFRERKSDPEWLLEWNSLSGVDNLRSGPWNLSTHDVSFHAQISSTLREIILAVEDLDDVTSREIRSQLELRLDTDLYRYKSFIDEEMMRILGQMEAPALILDHLYLGTEWNASHEQGLFERQIGFILNVTAEIDNFFPTTFQYMNIPVSDNEETDLLRYFGDSYKFISKALSEGSSVLVHCKMGISRSATIVLAYVMKQKHWNLSRALKYVTERRSCVKPNPNFMRQLEIYEGMLTAKRSFTQETYFKSETTSEPSELVNSPVDSVDSRTPPLDSLPRDRDSRKNGTCTPPTGLENTEDSLLVLHSVSESLLDPETQSPTSMSGSKVVLKSARHPFNGHMFSVSPNQVINISSVTDNLRPRVRHLVSEFESHNNG